MDSSMVVFRSASTTTPITTATITTTTTNKLPSSTSNEKPYYAKRPHRKSRTGCRNCKSRKVKCDEGRPSCRACTVRSDICVYPVITPRTGSSGSSGSSSSKSKSSPPTAYDASRPKTSSPVVKEPLFIAAGHDETDMKLLWFFTNATYVSFSSGPYKERNVNKVLKIDVIQHCFANPFLMDCVLGLASMHINMLGNHRELHVPPSRELVYRARAIEGYRKAVNRADPKTYPALLACSLLLVGLSTYIFRSEDAEPLCITNWITIWRGIGVIIDITSLPKLAQSGLLPLVYRPEVDLDRATQHIPASLVFMVANLETSSRQLSPALTPPPSSPPSCSSPSEDFDEKPYMDAYRLALKYLGSLYLELSHGFSYMLIWRIMTFFTFLPAKFIEALGRRRPPALVILSHYLAFTQFNVKFVWWLAGIAEHEIPSIFAYLGPQWAHFLQVPMTAYQIADEVERARYILNDPTWVPKEVKVKLEPETSEAEKELQKLSVEEVERLKEAPEEVAKRKIKYKNC
ncbi:hypothetical protein QBC35DRAFT_86950 [Podospora australis]|uniref:Zn(2)-C6 fungal-type domain-containing protein n=1 Tax=Podospora australis TaxID=1536484 RepID=A0AAN6WZ22_9PEZI|nr:hypothetical protein QBC35DRAFT_86950 [Podospora australis]